MKPYAWNGIHLQLPDDWEMLQFSKDPAHGRIVFGDRYQLRFELDWAALDLPPDLGRMAEDYTAKLIQDGIKEARPTARHPWLGVTGLQDGARISRYCAYFNDRTYLLEAIFLWPQDDNPRHNPQFEARLLETIRVVPLQDDHLQEWNAFGIRCLAPDDHRLDDCLAEPANVRLTFTSPDRRLEETAARIGMLKAWLNRGLDDYLRSLIPKDYSLLSMSHATQDGHDVWTAEATITRAVLTDWWHGRRHFSAAAWICPNDQRLRILTRTAPDRRDGLPPPPFALSCCDKLEVTL